ncbi:basic helix-loop-helix protein-like [Oryza sativa Japonica Group]|uniref:Basic helix-loop-helix protein-like n=1 Tax=Oryza sativa subsp. japonica TaxID=39947 RepID=Q5SMX2_ORYSJ|nr:basic helix-loop-helix protein-like [Oryza sativa Japonica Group]
MDSSSWIHGYTNANATGANSGFMCGYAASPVEFPQQQQLISMQMGMDDESAVYDGASMVGDLLMASSSAHHAGAGSFQYSSSTTSSSASFRSASVSCNPESSAAAAPELPAATGGAFSRYARHLRPRRPPKPGACGQRMFKTAMSVLANMHVAATYRRQYYYQQAAAAAAAEAAPAPPSDNQLQHMISERKRREKLNDSFVALKAVLPTGSKKDKASILIRAREHIKSLESKLSELEEKNRELEARLASRPAAKNDKGETAAAEAGDETKREDLVEIEVTTTSGGSGAAAAAATGGDQETCCTLNVDLRGGGGGGMSTTDVVLRTLQCLREQIGDGASLVAMSTSAGSGGRPPSANLTLQLKSPTYGRCSYKYEFTLFLVNRQKPTIKHIRYGSRKISMSLSMDDVTMISPR